MRLGLPLSLGIIAHDENLAHAKHTRAHNVLQKLDKKNDDAADSLSLDRATNAKQHKRRALCRCRLSSSP